MLWTVWTVWTVFAEDLLAVQRAVRRLAVGYDEPLYGVRRLDVRLDVRPLTTSV